MGKGRFLDKLKTLEGVGRFSLDFFVCNSRKMCFMPLRKQQLYRTNSPGLFSWQNSGQRFQLMIPRMHPSGHTVFDSPGYF